MYLIYDIYDAIAEYGGIFESSSSRYCESVENGYKLIDHAYELMRHDGELYLSDVISNLRKAVNYRVSVLFENLGIDKLKFNGLGKQRKLEKLGELDIVKPLLINKLLSIRNGIEYDGNSPPSKAECEELTDIVWYFYRSTDRYCNVEPDDFLIDHGNGKDYLQLVFDFKEHKTLQLSGHLSPQYFSENADCKGLKLYEYNIREIESLAVIARPIQRFSANVMVDDVEDYTDIFSMALYELGNF